MLEPLIPVQYTITFNDLCGELFQDFKKYLEKERKL
jgi:hypothetical protein